MGDASTGCVLCRLTEVMCLFAGQLNDMELENQGLQAQLADTTTQLQNAAAAHEEAAAGAAQLQASLQAAQAGAAAASAELSACTSKVQPRTNMPTCIQASTASPWSCA